LSISYIVPRFLGVEGKGDSLFIVIVILYDFQFIGDVHTKTGQKRTAQLRITAMSLAKKVGGFSLM
jgi:hypothetical protein